MTWGKSSVSSNTMPTDPVFTNEPHTSSYFQKTAFFLKGAAYSEPGLPTLAFIYNDKKKKKKRPSTIKRGRNIGIIKAPNCVLKSYAPLASPVRYSPHPCTTVDYFSCCWIITLSSVAAELHSYPLLLTLKLLLNCPSVAAFFFFFGSAKCTDCEDEQSNGIDQRCLPWSEERDMYMHFRASNNGACEYINRGSEEGT